MAQFIKISDKTMHRLRIKIASENNGRTYGFIGPTAEEAINEYLDRKDKEYEDEDFTLDTKHRDKNGRVVSH